MTIRPFLLATLVTAITASISPVNAAAPVVSNVTASQLSGSQQVEIRYTLADADSDSCTVWVQVSDNDGASWAVAASSFSGDVGAGIRPGSGKRIVWSAGTDMPNRFGYFRFRVSADDGHAPSGTALIPGGDFQMGNSFDASEGYPDELPRHIVHVDSFFMDRYEVTNQQYATALNWAKTNGRIYVSGNVVYGTTNNWGYCDTTASSSYSRITWNGSTFGVVAGKENHPVVQVSWFGAAAYSNWRSDMEGRGASYTYSGTDPNWNCNFLSGGYRLPTEAEWEYAARGGVAGTRFPWSDSNNIQHARANYYSDAGYSYDTSPTRGFHPTFATGNYPYTSPVGYFAANGYGLYDMAGNVWEWCNDWYSSTYYSVSTYPNPPRGPVTGNYRVLRGGSWYFVAGSLRCAYRGSDAPDYGLSFGFRLALDSE